MEEDWQTAPIPQAGNGLLELLHYKHALFFQKMEE